MGYENEEGKRSRPLTQRTRFVCATTFLFRGSTTADGVTARAVDVRCFFHGLTLRAAILARCGHASTNRMGAFLNFRRGHRFTYLSNRPKWSGRNSNLRD